MGNYQFALNADLPWDKMDNANVLVTGANGMIASVFAETLLAVNKEKDLHMNVYALSRNAERAGKRFEKHLTDPAFHILAQDVTEPLPTAVDFQYIIHAASAAHPDAMNNHPVDVMRANFIGTMNLLEYARGCSHCRFLFVSSSEVYGENTNELPYFTEDMAGDVIFTRFRACYPESKRASETLCQCYKKQYGCDVIVVRPAFIYGKNIIDDNTRADVYFLRQALAHKDIVMFSKGEQIRSYCYVNDCVLGMLFALLKGENGEAYNIGDKNCEISLRDYAQKLADAANVSLILDTGSKPSSTVFLKTTKLILDTAKLEELGWHPQYSLDDGIQDIFNEET